MQGGVNVTQAVARSSSAWPVATMQMVAETMINRCKAPDQKFYLVVLPDNAFPRIEEYESIELLRRGIQNLIGQNVWLFPFMGYHFGISRGPHRYLMTPFGPLPLFETPDPQTAQLEEDGFVGIVEEELEAPSAPSDGPEVRQPTTQDRQDEEDEAAAAEVTRPPLDDDDTPVLPTMSGGE